jgi:hypothetical protein
MPVSRPVPHSSILTGPGVDGGSTGTGSGAGGSAGGAAGGGGGAPMDTGDGADDGGEADDGRLYCWCQVGSYGDMVACDDNECEREWVSVLPNRSAAGFHPPWGSGVVGCSSLLTFRHRPPLSCSSTWGASASRWPRRACGSAMRAESSPRIDASWRARPLRVGAIVVRVGILDRRVHHLRLDSRFEYHSSD